MKMMKVVFSVAVVMMLFASGLAQDLPMIQSKDALRTYAIEQADHTWVWIGTSTPSNEDSWSYEPVKHRTAAGICDALSSMSMSLDVINSNDWIYINSGAYNVDGDPLFVHNKAFLLVEGKGGRVLPDDYGNVTLTLAEFIPIRIEGIQAAIIQLLDSNGRVFTSDSIRVRDGKIYYPRQLTSTNAVLSVYGKKDGVMGWRHWDVMTGAKITPKNYDVAFKPTVQGIVSYKDVKHVWVSVPTTNGVGNNLTVEYQSSTQSWTAFSFYTTEGKWFTGAYVRKAGTSEWIKYPARVVENAVTFEAPLSQGVHYVIPIWARGDLTEPADPWHPSWSGGVVDVGGKG